jgi:hypothetical protein
MRGRFWGPDDVTGGPVDEVFAQVRRMVPGLMAERLEVAHAGDDDNVYFLGDGGGLDRVQLDTGRGGRPPFVIEARDHNQVVALDVVEAVVTIRGWLDSGDVGPGDDLA